MAHIIKNKYNIHTIIQKTNEYSNNLTICQKVTIYK